MSDSRGVESAADSAAELRFARLYDLNQRPIRDYCRRRLPADRVDDAVAEVFLTMWRKLEDVPDDDAARLWLYRVAYRVVGHQWRSTTRRRRLEQRLRSATGRAVPGLDDAVIERDEHRLVLLAAARLGNTDGEVLRLSAWEQLSIVDIATLLDIEPNAVKQRLHRARRNLAEEYRRLDTPSHSTPDALKGGAQ
jgi:RNA polymerase sigma-70 factor (ECF subfamily)